jgi:phosphate starvation-inducible PhoH-like protein
MKKDNTEKRVPKGEISYRIQLSDEQKEVKQGVFEKDVTIIMGRQASGKTQVAVLCALDLLHKRLVNQIIISRPVIKDSIGLLPGTMKEKMEYQVAPIIQCLYAAYNPQIIDKYLEEKIIQILPIDYMKGITFQNACTIITEFEDCTWKQFENVLTRLGKGSKLIFEGSLEQIDKSVGKESCLHKVMKLEKAGLVNYHILKSNHRNEDIFKILDYIDAN